MTMRMTGGTDLLRASGLGPWWRGRTARERVLILGMGLALAVYAAIACAVQPMLGSRAAALESIALADAALARLEASPGGDGAAVSARATVARPVTAVLADTATDFGLTILRIEPEGAGARLTLGEADFAELLDWISALEREHGLRLTAVEMDRRPEPGVVAALLTVER